MTAIAKATGVRIIVQLDETRRKLKLGGVKVVNSGNKGMVWELHSIGAELHYSLRHHLLEVLLPLSAKLASGRLRGGSSGICRTVLCIYLKGGSRTVMLTATQNLPQISSAGVHSSATMWRKIHYCLFVGRNSVVGTVVNASAVCLYRKAAFSTNTAVGNQSRYRQPVSAQSTPP